MKRILQVLGSLQLGGAETMVMNVYRHINREEIQFDFLVKERVDNGYESEVEALGGRIICVNSPKSQGTKAYIKEVSNAIKANGPYDAVHSHMNVISGPIMVASFYAGVKNRISHSHSIKFPYSLPIRIAGKMMIKLFSTKKVACGEAAGKALFGKSEFVIIENGIEANQYCVKNLEEKDNLRKSLGFAENYIHICHVGRFVDVKNHPFILDIAEELKRTNHSYIIHLVGDGDNYKIIKEEAKKRDLNNVVFHGTVKNVKDLLKASDIFILPSKYEGVPITVIEAQCAGLMCLLSDNVPDEVNLKIGLIKHIPLISQYWINEILNAEPKESIPFDLILEAVERKEFDINVATRKMSELY